MTVVDFSSCPWTSKPLRIGQDQPGVVCVRTQTTSCQVSDQCASKDCNGDNLWCFDNCGQADHQDTDCLGKGCANRQCGTDSGDTGQPDSGATDEGLADPGQPDPGPAQCVAIDWVAIPGGTFQMGATDMGSEEQPVHEVTVPGFKISRTEVTVCQYQSCVTAGTCTAAHSTQSGDNYPVVNVDWNQSKAFCVWAGGRLCSEAEWEYAARNGSAGNLYPWGDSAPTCDDAVYSDLAVGCGYSVVASACSKPTGNDTWGVCDLAGNVEEWVEDDRHHSYTGAPTNGSAWVDSPRASLRVVRSGSYGVAGGAGELRASYRNGADPGYEYGNFGAHCCMFP